MENTKNNNLREYKDNLRKNEDNWKKLAKENLGTYC